MRRWIVPLLAASLVGPVVHADAIRVEHTPLTCVPAERYVRLRARAVPADAAASAELQFRLYPAAEWYGVEMTQRDDEWSATLPRAQRSLQGFEYRIVMHSETGQWYPTPPIAVVVAAPAACPTPSTESIRETLKVLVPTGAPISPPVPPGFDPARAVSAREPEREPDQSKNHHAITIAVAAGVAGTVTALAIKGGTGESAKSRAPVFGFVRALPAPGATLSDDAQLLVFIHVDSQSTAPLGLRWIIDLLGNAKACQARMEGSGSYSVDADLVLTAPLAFSDACGAGFDVGDSQLTVFLNDEAAAKIPLPLHYHVER